MKYNTHQQMYNKLRDSELFQNQIESTLKQN